MLVCLYGTKHPISFIIILHVATFYHSMYTLFITFFYTKNIPIYYNLSLLNRIALLYTDFLFLLLLLLKGIKLQIMKGG